MVTFITTINGTEFPQHDRNPKKRRSRTRILCLLPQIYHNDLLTTFVTFDYKEKRPSFQYF